MYAKVRNIECSKVQTLNHAFDCLCHLDNNQLPASMMPAAAIEVNHFGIIEKQLFTECSATITNRNESVVLCSHRAGENHFRNCDKSPNIKIFHNERIEKCMYTTVKHKLSHFALLIFFIGQVLIDMRRSPSLSLSFFLWIYLHLFSCKSIVFHCVRTRTSTYLIFSTKKRRERQTAIMYDCVSCFIKWTWAICPCWIIATVSPAMDKFVMSANCRIHNLFPIIPIMRLLSISHSAESMCEFLFYFSQFRLQLQHSRSLCNGQFIWICIVDSRIFSKPVDSWENSPPISHFIAHILNDSSIRSSTLFLFPCAWSDHTWASHASALFISREFVLSDSRNFCLLVRKWVSSVRFVVNISIRKIRKQRAHLAVISSTMLASQSGWRGEHLQY